MIVEKAAPRLGGRFSLVSHVLSHSSLARLDTDLEEFPVDARRSPEPDWPNSSCGSTPELLNRCQAFPVPSIDSSKSNTSRILVAAKRYRALLKGEAALGLAIELKHPIRQVLPDLRDGTTDRESALEREPQSQLHDPRIICARYFRVADVVRPIARLPG